MILGLGTDIIEIDRVDRLHRLHGERFLRLCFTDGERDYALARKHAAQHLAARFAAKEAVMKALGTGWGRGVRWRDIEVRREPGGAPRVVLSGGASRRARAIGVDRLHLSISHLRGEAIAFVVAEGGDVGRTRARGRGRRKRSRGRA